jgi:hypothetical protein
MRAAVPRAAVEPRSCPLPWTCTPSLVDDARRPLSRLPGALLATGLAAGALLAGVLDGTLTGWRDVEPQLPIAVAGSRTLPVPLRVLLVLDQSGSTSSTDPTRESNRAVLLVCDWLAHNSEDSRDRVGLVRFADRAEAIAPVLAGEADQTLARALAGGESLGGGTRLAPAIAALQGLLAHAHAGERDVVLLVTDGQVAEPDDQLRALIGRLRAEADAVYLLGLDGDGMWSKETHRRYDDLGLNGTIPVSKLTAGRLAYAIATLLMGEAGLEPARR